MGKETRIENYFDNAAGEPLRAVAMNAMTHCMEKCNRGEYANPSNIMSQSGGRAASAINQARQTISNILGDRDKEHPIGRVYFTSGGTEANNMAIYSAILTGIQKGFKNPSVLVSAIEHKSVLNAGRRWASELGGSFSTIRCPDGFVDMEDFEVLAGADTALVAVMHTNNELGTIQPIKEIAELCYRWNIPLLVDCTQAMGHTPIDVKELPGVSYITASAHKFGGPAGTGFLWARNEVLYPDVRVKNLLCGGGQENQSRPGTENLIGIVGMEAALVSAVNEKSWFMLSSNYVQQHFENRLLAEVPDCIINGINGQRSPAHVSVSFKGIDGAALALRLSLDGFTVSTGSACNSSEKVASYVLREAGVPYEYAHGTIRVTFNGNHYKSMGAVDALVDSIVKNVKKLRSYERKKKQ